MLIGLFYTNQLPFISQAKKITPAWTECTDCFIAAILNVFKARENITTKSTKDTE